MFSGNIPAQGQQPVSAFATARSQEGVREKQAGNDAVAGGT